MDAQLGPPGPSLSFPLLRHVRMFASTSSQHGCLVQGNAFQEAKAEATDPLRLRLTGYTMSLLPHSAGHQPARLQYERGLLPRRVAQEAGSLGAVFRDQLLQGGDHPGWLLITLGLHSTLLCLHVGVKTKKLSPQGLRAGIHLSLRPLPLPESSHLTLSLEVQLGRLTSTAVLHGCTVIEFPTARPFISDIMSKLVSLSLPILSNRPLVQTSSFRAMFLMQAPGPVSGLLKSLCRMGVPGTHPRRTKSELLREWGCPGDFYF